MWQRLRAYFRPEPLASADALRTFVEERASLIAQKCAIDYVRGKTGLASYALFTEEPFLKALDVCRWETFVVVLGDLLLLADGYLRTHAASDVRPQLREALIALYRSSLRSLPAVAHRPQGWADELDAFTRRLNAAAEPQRTLNLADHSAKRLFDTLPIHVSMRKFDQEVVYGAVRFRMIAVSQEMERRLAAAEVVRQLLA